MTHKTRILSWLAGVSSAAVLGAPQASAQESAAPSARLEEIVVVANRREETQQKVPITITAVSAETLRSRGSLDVESLKNVVPGLVTDRQANSAAFFLRGVGAQAAPLGTEAPVALYVDDVYILGGHSTLFEFNNIERVEVLKGPQGTLFGRNATGGVIHVITKDPGPKPQLDASIGYANYNTLSGDIYASTPITDKLGVNLAFHGSNQEDGWGHNLNNGEKLYYGWDWGVRGKVLLTPSENTRIRLGIDVNRVWGQQGLALHPQPGTFIAGPGGARIGYEGFYNSRDLHAGTYSGTTVLTPSERGISDFYETKQEGISLKAEHDMGYARLVSITSYRHVQSNFFLDQDGGPLVTSDSFIRMYDANYSQEVQVQSPEGSKIGWIAGGYYLHDTARYNPYENKGSGRSPNTLKYFAEQETDSWAVFGQATVPIYTYTHLTLGARYTRDERTVSANFFSYNPSGVLVSSGIVTGAPLPGGQVVSLTDSWPKLTYRLTLDHQFTDDILAYVSYNRGFKSGVYNFLRPPAGAAPTTSTILAPANPEVLDAYEAGVKTEWFDHRLRVNASGFWYKYKQLQFTAIAAGITNTVNAGAADIKGADLEITVVPTDRLTVTTALSVLSGKYTSFPGSPHLVPQGAAVPDCGNPPVPAGTLGGQVSGAPAAGCDLTGRDTIHTPPVSVSVGFAYTIPVSFGDFELGANWAYTGAYFWEPDNSVRSTSSNIVNASLKWTSQNGRLDVTVWGKNLLDEEIYSYANNTTLGTLFSPAPPLTYGVRFWNALGWLSGPSTRRRGLSRGLPRAGALFVPGGERLACRAGSAYVGMKTGTPRERRSGGKAMTVRVTDTRSKVSTRELIVDQAIELFAAKGFEAISLRDIAAASGVSLGTVYYHFPEKNRLCEAAVNTAFERRRVKFRTQLRRGRTQEESLRTFFGVLADVILNDVAENRVVRRILTELDEAHWASDLALVQPSHWTEALEFLRVVAPKCRSGQLLPVLYYLAWGMAMLQPINRGLHHSGGRDAFIDELTRAGLLLIRGMEADGHAKADEADGPQGLRQSVDTLNDSIGLLLTHLKDNAPPPPRARKRAKKRT